jgi:hypothetical protein
MESNTGVGNVHRRGDYADDASRIGLAGVWQFLMHHLGPFYPSIAASTIVMNLIFSSRASRGILCHIPAEWH